MPTTTFEAFKAELYALRDVVSSYTRKTIRDEALRERFRTLFRTWASIVRPAVEHRLQSKREFLKLGAELEAMAQLASKYKSVSDYRKRLNRAIQLSDNLVIFLPAARIERPASIKGSDLFLPAIPDLPSKFIPNALFGWMSRMEAFLNDYPFDKSVFIMVRYRKKNEKLIKEIKSILSSNGHHGILASEHNLTDDLYNPIACLLCCSKGIAIFDKAEAGAVFNPNVAYELGMLHLLGRECLILKHRTLETLHTDILMKLYLEYTTIVNIRAQIRDWISRF